MSDEKPLHVRVAEALGCKPDPQWGWHCTCKDLVHAEHTIRADCHSTSGLNCDVDELAFYDTDWAATGPLVEKYHLSLQYIKTDCTYAYQAYDDVIVGQVQRSYGYGEQPLIAICNLILALKEIGKL